MTQNPPPAPASVAGQQTMAQSASGLDAYPRWMQQLAQYLPICSQLVVEGNIRDVHLIHSQDGLLLQPIINCLWELLRERGCEALLVYDTASGLRVFPSERQADMEQRLTSVGQPSEGDHPLTVLAKQLYEVAAARELCCAFVIDYASRLANEDWLFTRCQKLADTTQELRPPQAGKLGFNPIIWLADRANDLPSWFAVGNDRIHDVFADLPDQQARLDVAERLARDLPGVAQMNAQDRAKAVNTFATLSDGLTVRAMMQIRSLAYDQKLPFGQIGDAVRSYRVGISDTPWRQTYLYDRIRDGEAEITKSVKGQARAVQQTLDILKRSVTGLTAAQSSSSGNKPRGILFFAGPTGVGKTELAKAVTRLLFGVEEAYIRFDMSEFADDIVTPD